jgi:hypothetical protein
VLSDVVVELATLVEVLELAVEVVMMFVTVVRVVTVEPGMSVVTTIGIVAVVVVNVTDSPRTRISNRAESRT